MHCSLANVKEIASIEVVHASITISIFRPALRRTQCERVPMDSLDICMDAVSLYEDSPDLWRMNWDVSSAFSIVTVIWQHGLATAFAWRLLKLELTNHQKVFFSFFVPELQCIIRVS